ncbi:MAG: hypothetical protein MUF52_11290 [Syntrophobacteraceae bacterium]|jgi:hypothetical protein|nr:hypothetical protein [Syntrophobacteraceae bacterium]
MEECKTCELAIYCYSDSTTWIFRTKQEMEEKRETMENCPHQRKLREHRSVEEQSPIDR